MYIVSDILFDNVWDNPLVASTGLEAIMLKIFAHYSFMKFSSLRLHSSYYAPLVPKFHQMQVINLFIPTR